MSFFLRAPPGSNPRMVPKIPVAPEAIDPNSPAVPKHAAITLLPYTEKISGV